MSLKEMKEATFTSFTENDWKEKSEKALKGRSVESLAKGTYEKIKLKPLYLPIEQDVPQYPGERDFRRGYSETNGENKCHVAQLLRVDSEKELEDKLLQALESGQTSISLHLGERHLDYVHQLFKYIGKYPFSIHAGKHLTSIISKLIQHPEAKATTGYIVSDPIEELVTVGSLSQPLDESYDELSKTLTSSASSLPNLRTILVNSTPYHNGGANAIQELAISLSTAVTHIEALLDRHIPLSAILSNIVFEYSIGANFFMEIAKLRAARALWSRITEAYGAIGEEQKMVISARTSMFTKTLGDPYVNLLRAGNEAFAAAVGGIQYLHVSPYTEPSGVDSAFSERVARNMQLILQEEALLTKTIDPAGGSWYIEELTDELIERAWDKFLEIEDAGGLIEILQSGQLQKEIAEIAQKRILDVATRRQIIVGTNQYADLNGESLEVTDSMREKGHNSPETAIKPIRLSEGYEGLRYRTSQLANTPTVELLCLGELKDYKIRTDFMTNFLSPGGIAVKLNESISDVEDVVSVVPQLNTEVVCICGSNDDYDRIGLDIIRKLKEVHPEKIVLLAGLPERTEDWKQAGITYFIHAKSNCYETLFSLLTEMEAHSHA